MNLKSNHKAELERAIHPDIVELNFQSLSEDLAYEYLLYGLDRTERRNDGRLRDYWIRKYAHLVDGGWWCSGYDVVEKKPSLWGCFKPDTPREGNSNKLIKYETPPKVNTEIFALSVPLWLWDKISSELGIERSKENFWDWVIDNPKIPLVITEGAKKAGALLTAGYVAVAVPGINNACSNTEEDVLIAHLSLFCQKSRQITFAYDSDRKWKTVQAVSKAILKTGKIFEENGCEVYVAQWRTTDGKGVDDLIVNKGLNSLSARQNVICKNYVFDLVRRSRLFE